jgi:hypothetical protein
MPSGNDFPIHLPVGTNRDKEVGGKLQKESCPLFAGTVPAKDILVRTGVPEVAFAFGLAQRMESNSAEVCGVFFMGKLSEYLP